MRTQPKEENVILTIEKRFPTIKGVIVGVLALTAGFLSSVTVLNILDGAQAPATPIAEVSTSEGGEVLGASTSRDSGDTEDKLGWNHRSYGMIHHPEATQDADGTSARGDTSSESASSSEASVPKAPAPQPVPPVTNGNGSDCSCDTSGNIVDEAADDATKQALDPVETTLNQGTDVIKDTLDQTKDTTDDLLDFVLGR